MGRWFSYSKQRWNQVVVSEEMNKRKESGGIVRTFSMVFRGVMCSNAPTVTFKINGIFC